MLAIPLPAPPSTTYQEQYSHYLRDQATTPRHFGARCVADRLLMRSKSTHTAVSETQETWLQGTALLGSSKKWSLWREGHLQNKPRQVLHILGILGIVLWVVSRGCDAWTPAVQIISTNRSIVHWGWSYPSKPRTQDNFICGANQRCITAKVTLPGSAWRPAHNPRKYLPTYVLLKQDDAWVQITNKTTIGCCNLPCAFEFWDLYKQLEVTRQCANGTIRGLQNITNFSAQDLQILNCYNLTAISNAIIWAQYLMFVHINATKIDPGHIKRLPSTCKKVGQHAQKTVLHTQITFPPSKTCPKGRIKRAWYDTLLGGYGSLTGTLNGFDIETLANRLHNAGSKINDALTLQAKWMPTTYYPAMISAGVDTMIADITGLSV
ncbi:uncharacterized protein [Hyperolius riggenbachi]|uniref:uncharacterized protein isoform X3 n=1 Tax=Hyperolius riggenbachi TaxID=752182 RepID=UPI0035A2D6C8